MEERRIPEFWALESTCLEFQCPDGMDYEMNSSGGFTVRPLDD